MSIESEPPHAILILLAYAQKPPLNANDDLSNTTRSLNFGLRLYLVPRSVYVGSKMLWRVCTYVQIA